jgi:PAS domain S-box-containing protein
MKKKSNSATSGKKAITSPNSVARQARKSGSLKKPRGRSGTAASTRSQTLVSENTLQSELASSSGKRRPSYEELEQALIECKEKYRTAFEHSLIGLYRTTRDGRILLVNQALLNMLGYPDFGELAERNLETSGYEPSYSRTRFIDEIEREGRVIGWESAWLRKNGSILHVRESARAIRDDEGNTVYYEGTVEDITQRKRAEERLQLLSSIVEQSNEGIALTDLNGKVTFVNYALSRMHGYSPEELLNRKLSTFHSPDQRAGVKNVTSQVLKNGEYRGETMHQRKDGSTLPLEMHNSLLRDRNGKPVGIISVMIDLTERKRAEAVLKAANEQITATLNALPDTFLEIDEQGCILDFRAPESEAQHCPPQDFRGERIMDCLPETASGAIMASVKRAARSGQDSGATYKVELQGRTCWFELSVAAKGSPGTKKGTFIALMRDVTERKQTEDQLRQLAEELKAEREMLTEKNIALKQILDHIEHQRKDYRRDLTRELKRAIRPYLSRLKRKTNLSAKDVEEMELTIQTVLTKGSKETGGTLESLSPREKEICALISLGLSSKEISERLVLSPATIHKHREQIRRKLGLTNKNVNLSNYLKSHRSSRHTQ